MSREPHAGRGPSARRGLLERVFTPLEGTADGRPFVALPWDSANDVLRWKLPLWARGVGRPATWLFVAGGALLVAGMIFQLRAATAGGGGLLAALCLAYRQARARLSGLHLMAIEAPARVVAGEPFAVAVTVKNRGAEASGRVILRIGLDWTAEREVYAVEAPLAPQEARRILLATRAQRGMGHFRLSYVHLAASDEANLFPLCVLAEPGRAVEVVEPSAAVDTPAVAKHNLLSRLQTLEVPAKGEEGTIRGLRPFTTGDALRRIDWRRSARLGELVVRDQSRLTSCDAAVFVDQHPDGHSGYGEVSSFRSLRVAALAVARGLLAQGLRVQLHGGGVALPLGAGPAQDEAVEAALGDLTLLRRVGVGELVEERKTFLAPESFAVLLTSSAAMASQDLWAAMLALDARRIEVLLVVFDSEAFAGAARAAAMMRPGACAAVEELRRKLGQDQAIDLRRIAARVAERALVVGPDDQLYEIQELMREEQHGRGQAAVHRAG